MIARALSSIRESLFVALRPSLWIQNYKYSEIVDNHIKSLNWSKVIVDGDHYVTVDGTTLWYKNHPYASFRIGDKLPKRKTRIELMNAISSHIEEYEIGKTYGNINNQRK